MSGKRSVDDVHYELVALARQVDQLERARIKGVAWLGIVVMFAAYCLPAVVYTSKADEDEVSVMRPFTLPWDFFGDTIQPDERVVAIVMGIGVLWGLIGFLAWTGLPDKLRWWGVVGQVFLVLGLLGEAALGFGSGGADFTSEPGPGLWLFLVGCALGLGAHLMTMGYWVRSGLAVAAAEQA